MNIVVQKYGGTSVENKEKMNKICDNIISCYNKKNKVVVVVSACGNYTDELIKKASDFASLKDKRSLDMLLMTGEVQSAALLSMILNDKGYNTICFNGAQAGIITDSTYGSANIKYIYEENIKRQLNEGKIVVVTGFQGNDKCGNITTLGRGGSDLSAVAIAASLKAKRCEIYSDVDGIFSADPRIIDGAKLLNKISYDEMLEAATAGAKVLHNRAVSVAKKYNVPIYVANSIKKSRGSFVKNNKNDEIEKYEVKFITKNDEITKISIIGDMMLSNKEAVSKIYDIALKENIVIHMITFSEYSINIIVDSTVANQFIKELHENLINEN